jgi:hypothetical protein
MAGSDPDLCAAADVRQDRRAIAATILSRRTAPRAKVFQRADLRLATSHARGHILNLSTRGALIHSAALPDAGRRIELLFAGLKRSCTIVWRSGRHAGVSFVNELTQSELTAAIDHVAEPRRHA